MIFVDTNVFMYAVGKEHPLREEARRFFISALESGEVLVSSAEVLQELLHAYLPAEVDDVRLARTLVGRHPGLGARDLLHLSSCQRRQVRRIKTFDRALAEAFRGGSGQGSGSRTG